MTQRNQRCLIVSVEGNLELSHPIALSKGVLKHYCNPRGMGVKRVSGLADDAIPVLRRMG
jgi:hypothetical protein